MSENNDKTIRDPRHVREEEIGDNDVKILLGFFGLMAWTGLNMVTQQLRMNETIATLGWPSWVIGMVVPLSALVAIVCTIASLRDHRATIALDTPGDSQ